MSKEKTAPIDSEQAVDKSKLEDLYCRAREEIAKLGGKPPPAAGPYTLLKRLADLKGVDMNGRKGAILKEFRISKAKLRKLAIDALETFVYHGHFFVPPEFKFRERNQYRHDGDANANRNLWKANKKVYTKRGPKEPVVYGNLNTKKK